MTSLRGPDLNSVDNYVIEKYTSFLVELIRLVRTDTISDKIFKNKGREKGCFLVVIPARRWH